MSQILKSLFIVTYPLLALIGLAIAVDQYIHGYLFAAIGLALITIPFLFLMGKLFLTDVARTDANLSIFSILILLGALFLAYAFYTDGAESMSGLGFVLALFWFLYIYWYSTFGDRSNPILKEGALLPLLKLEDENGNTVSSDSFRGKKNILMFYRGNWCPLCMAQIKEISQDYKMLEANGIQTVLISPQPHRHTKHLAKKFDVGFKFLVDKNSAVAKQLNIMSKNGLPAGFQALGYDSDTVMPTIILTDEQGEILHADLTSNYRVRPEPKDLIRYFI